MPGGSALPRLLLLAACVEVAVPTSDGDAVFIREFPLSRLLEEQLAEAQRHPDASSRTARSEEDRDTLWDTWGSWSECSRTCGGGASYSLRRCLSSKSCEGQNIKYRSCGTADCPPEAGDFRAQQCSAHADVRFQGRYHEWLPVYDDPENPCALKCRARDSGLVLELAPKVLDGTRCYSASLDMCISGACQVVGCDRQLGSAATEDNCGVCGGDGATCRLVRGHYRSQQDSGRNEDTVVVVPHRSRHLRLVLKGPDHLYLESQTLQGVLARLDPEDSGLHQLENTTLDFQKLPQKEVLRTAGPLGADFTVKVRLASGAASTVQYSFYQPIVHRWRETDFFPCSVSCGGGYQLTSAECLDLRSGRVVADQDCQHHPENVKPKPRLQECSPEPCPASDGYKQIMPYDLYHPLPRWESGPWTSCSASCGGGVQSRSVSCVEEDVQGVATAAEEWKCLYAPKADALQACNDFACPGWLAQDWSPCTATCGQGLRYRVVLCMDHRGLHAGGCDPTAKPPIKEACLAALPCYKPPDTLPVEAKPAWHKQAIELEEEEEGEEPTFVPGPWQPCSSTCGAGTQQRSLSCRVRLSFSQTVADLPDPECQGPKPAVSRPCRGPPCPQEGAELHHWEYGGFAECSESCGGGTQEAVVVCLNRLTRQAADQRLCVSSRPPPLLRACRTQPCPPRWVTGEWTSCSAPCGVGLMSRSVECVQRPSRDGGRARTLRDQDCRDPKPSPVRACNRSDCAPVWEPGAWGQCSRSCGGGGVQTRRLLCRQRTADGSNPELPGSFCAPQSPPTQRPCSLRPCGNALEPEVVLPQEQLCVQWRKSRKLHLQVGGHAYLLPWTTLLLRCPAHQLRKGGVRWLKDGRPVSATPQGQVKIQQLRPSDAGVYTCVAASQRQQLVLHVLGGEKNPSAPDRYGRLVEQLLQLRRSLPEDEDVPPVLVSHAHRLDRLLSDGALGGPELLRLLTGAHPSTPSPLDGADTSRLAPFPHQPRIKAQASGGAGPGCDRADASPHLCSQRTNASQSGAACPGRRCPHRWRAEPWSPCSASCGGGSQTRSVRCGKASVRAGTHACLAAGRKPTASRPCNQRPCAGWAASPWGACGGPCMGPGLATQHRHVYCQHAGGAKVPEQTCGGLPRPGVQRNCSSRACAPQWRLGPWTPCTATCGGHGFQSRQVTCAHLGSGKAAKEHQCTWRPRPPSWQRCHLQPCAPAGRCQDSSRYCQKVGQLQLCLLPQFRKRCCQSCRNT